MKKIFLFAIIATAVIGSVIFYACKKEMNDNILLEQELTNLNESIHEQISHNKRQKGLGDWLKSTGETVLKTCAVAGSDIIGAAAGAKAVSPVAAAAVVNPALGAAVTVAGATICGAGASYGTYRAICNATPPIDPYPGSDNNWDYNNIGKYHNEVLYGLYTNHYPNSVGEINLYATNLVLNRVRIDDPNYAGIFSSPDWLRKMDYVHSLSINYVNNNSKIEDLLQLYRSKDLISQNVYTVLKSFFVAYSTIDEMASVNIVVQEYVNYVEHSAFLSDDDRKSLFSAFAVAENSPYFWIQVIEALQNSKQ
jgi:hypothetical protein